MTPVHADMQLEVRGETPAVNQYMVELVERIVEGVEKCYEVEGSIVRAGEATTLPVCDDLLEIVREVAEQVPGVKRVLDVSKPSGSEDCTMLMHRVIEHGGRAAYALYGANQNGHHRSDFDIQDEESLPIGFGLFTGFLRRMNGIAL